MAVSDGMTVLCDCDTSETIGDEEPAWQPIEKVRLWAIVDEDMVHAPERCAFGASREAGVVKHSNLTGGQDAFSGGEMHFVNPKTILFNGDSGRYGIRSLEETIAVGRVFVDSGYFAWHTGWDEGSDRPIPMKLMLSPVSVV